MYERKAETSMKTVDPELAQHYHKEIARRLFHIEGTEVLGKEQERLILITEAVSTALRAGLDAGFRPTNDGTGMVAYLLLPTATDGVGDTFEEVSYFLPAGRPYEGYDRTEKLARVRRFVDRWQYQ